MRKSLLFLSILAGILVPICSISQATLLGPADDYSIFVFGDVNVTSDSQGRVAAGGNIYMSNYSVGLLASPAEYSIIGGGNVSFGPGTIYNGGMFANGNIQLSNFGVMGDVTANGTISRSGGTITGTATPNSATAIPINFAGERSYLNLTSSSLAKMTPTGTTTVSPWGAIT